MPRPKNKNELIKLSNSNFNQMLELIKTFDKDEILNGKIPFEDRDKNIRDILAHLHHLHWVSRMNISRAPLVSLVHASLVIPELSPSFLFCTVIAHHLVIGGLLQRGILVYVRPRLAAYT